MCDKDFVKELYLAALESVMPRSLVPDALSYESGILQIEENSFDLNTYKHIHLYGSGKASVEMARALKKLLGEKISKACVISNYHDSIEGVEVLESTHPLPSQKSIDAGSYLIDAFEAMNEEDFFIYLLSGGSSALIEKPIFGVSLEDFIALSDLLLKQGLSIDEMNIIRTYFSDIKGGALGSKSVAKGMVLVVSDVIGDDLQTIGSAPLLPCHVEKKTVQELVDKYKLFNILPKSMQNILISDNILEKNSERSYPHFLIASNHKALQKAQKIAATQAKSVRIISDRVQGDVKEVADFILETIQRYPDEVLLFGGEPTVILQGDGKGGRNQELTLWVLKGLHEKGIEATFLSAGSDGIDGNSNAAGAVVCLEDYHDSIDAYLEQNDSYHYLQKRDALIMTGESGTNVMDIMIALT